MLRGLSELKIVPVGLLIMLASCASTDTSIGPLAPVGPEQLNDSAAQAQYASVFWKRYDVPDMRPINYKRVAIAEFAVEFVTRKIEANKSMSIEYSSYLMNHLPNALYGIFRKDLKSRGLEVLPTKKVRSSRAYARLDTGVNGMKPELNGSYHSGSDTGRVKELAVYSANGLAVIRGAGDVDFETIEAEMLEELSADVVLRVRIRVGAHGGHPSLERGSTVWLLSPNVAGNLTSDRSLISDVRVVEEEREQLGGVTLDIMVPRYEQGVCEMFPAFLNMAHLSANSALPLPSVK